MTLTPQALPWDNNKPRTLPLTANTAPAAPLTSPLTGLVVQILDDAKAENIVTIDLAGKTSIGDQMVVASGRSQRHVGAVADQLVQKLKENGYAPPRIEGLPQCDWVLIDAGDVIVHIFRPEVREFYNIEKMWLSPRPNPDAAG